jgi:stage IV sporulation protein FB
MLRFSLFGFPISVQWMFWVVVAILGGALDAETPQRWQALLFWVAAAFISILIHELGHTFMQRRYGARAQIVLYAFGGLAIPDRGFTRGQHIVVSLAGPLVQILCGVLVWEALNAWSGTRIPFNAIAVLSFHGIGEVPAVVVGAASFVLVSVFWGILNLIPVYPLDGGHVLLRFLGPTREKITYLVGMICAGGLALYSLAVQRSIWNTIICGMLAWDNFKLFRGERPPSILRP